MGIYDGPVPTTSPPCYPGGLRFADNWAHPKPLTMARCVAFLYIKQALKVGMGYAAALGRLEGEPFQIQGYRVSSKPT